MWGYALGNKKVSDISVITVESYQPWLIFSLIIFDVKT